MKQHKFPAKQSGVSFITVLALLGLLAFSLNFIVRIAGMHWDDRILESILDDLPEVLNKDSSVKDVQKLINNRLNMNRLRGIPTTELVITKQKGQLKLVWLYERRENVMSNIDIVLTFNHEYSY